jgi:hypothetical protein
LPAMSLPPQIQGPDRVALQPRGGVHQARLLNASPLAGDVADDVVVTPERPPNGFAPTRYRFAIGR